ncbi:bifunctional folylpolyglutamate synthase/dihydrofolate synthase [Roseomonas sp. OT10]|uniref:bifunctional folylpolyglutamate synthase/dihydrofolate synthase n=1 Tax=Roseomonas cutis TaxID=2897332 RepID=UPI001E367A33|nr:folylpolyglutamate synthase/dihydrofolate synthase family protein [Roseomonas sp. OT10]UFN51229.1 bifunctional folylpolyglutamate synthase/dihydrofolate synthase [Roseomonas sp. OT10]
MSGSLFAGEAPARGRSEAIIDRLHALHPKLIDLSLGRLQRCLAALGHPERALPPVVHVAGTNGKGSTCAFLRAIAEAAGQRVHVYTSPHLVRFHERIRLAGTLVTEAALAEALEEAERANAGEPITVFEITTAVALLLFSRVPADLLVLEVGLGGRFDATNVVDRPAACAVASVSMDHMEFLGDRLSGIAAEKAGIAKPGVPLVTGFQPAEAMAAIEAAAAEAGAPLLRRGRDWSLDRLPEGAGEGLRYADAAGMMDLPPPALPGPHQRENAGLAVAALRAWNPGWLSPEAAARGLRQAQWPARLQRLGGRLAARLPHGWELWLDGGHNAGGGEALSRQLDAWGDRPAHLVVGMKQSKAAADFLRPLVPRAASLWAVAEPGQHLAMTPDEIAAASGRVARPGPDVAGALAQILAAGGPPGRVLVCGSLYLAGEVLKADGTPVT